MSSHIPVFSFAPTVDSLRRVFQQGFIVHDIAEPLISFDDWTPTEKVREYVERRKLEIVGVRRDGAVEGYLATSELGAGICGDFIQSFDESQVVPDTCTIAELVLRLKERRRLFVSVLGRVGGIVSRTDLEKHPVRMWLFGMVTLIEMRFSRLIDQYSAEESWRPFLSQARVQKAKELLAERSRRNQQLRLLDCLQLSDKTQIVARSETLRGMTRFPSRRQLEKAGKMLEKLRNNLVHSQEIVAHDWETIVGLSEHLDSILHGPQEFDTDAV